MDTATTIKVALVAEQDRIMELIGDEVGDETTYAEAAYRVMCAVAPDLDPQRWERLTGLTALEPCRDWYNCCGWCSEHEEHCGRDDAERYEVCNKGHCHYCDHYCDNLD